MNGPQFNAKISELGITKREIAGKLGISEQAFYNKLNGQAEFKNSEIQKIARLLNLSMDAVNIIFFDGCVNVVH